MRWLTFLAVASGLVVSSCQSRAPAASVPSPASTGAETPAHAEELAHGWPVLGDLRHHCDGQVLGADGSEILWSVFISNRPSAEIAAFYEKRLGNELLEKTAAEWTWRAPTRDAPARVLTITGPGGWVPSECPKLPAGVGTLANVSQALRR